MRNWKCKDGTEIVSVPDGAYGFVYLITHIPSGKKYIGKKFFWSKKWKTVKKKRSSFLGESDWKEYFGSNGKLLEEIAAGDINEYDRLILHICKSKSECAYLEAKEQILADAILSPDYYNDWISLKVTRRHLTKYAKTL